MCPLPLGLITLSYWMPARFTLFWAVLQLPSMKIPSLILLYNMFLHSEESLAHLKCSWISHRHFLLDWQSMSMVSKDTVQYSNACIYLWYKLLIIGLRCIINRKKPCWHTTPTPTLMSPYSFKGSSLYNLRTHHLTLTIFHKDLCLVLTGPGVLKSKKNTWKQKLQTCNNKEQWYA